MFNGGDVGIPRLGRIVEDYKGNSAYPEFFDAYNGKYAWSKKDELLNNISSNKEGLGAALMGGAGLLGSTIAGGYSNKVADFASQAGDVVGAFNPLAGAAVKVGAGVLNRLIGSKVNQERLDAANQGTNYLNSYQSNASYFDDVKSPEAQAAVQDAYKGGLLVGGSARRKNQELRRQRANAELYADRSVFNNVENIANTQMDNMLANYAAYGGPLSVGLFPKGGNGSIFGRVNWGQMYAEGGDLNQDNSNLDAQTLAAIANMTAEEEADGGPNKYHTRLSSTDERKYKKWMRDFTRSRKWNYYEQVDNPDYDYRGYWKNYPKEAQKMIKGDKKAHFTDRYKTPSHPTFSNESIYSNEKTPGGQWRKDRNGRDVYVPSEYTAQFRNKTLNEFQRSFDNGESPTGYYNSSTGKTIYPTKYKKNTRKNTRRMAFGGSLHTAGTDWSNGLIEIDNGGTHEGNPMEGVPFGIAEDGQPNLVEEGEAIFNDYVFSDRLKVPKAIRNMYKLRGQKDLTYAEAAKKMAKESKERPNDPISQRGLEALLGDLQAAQEQSRQEMAMEEAAQERVEQSDILGAIFAANGGKITIKPSKRGTFTAEATRHKMSVQEFAEEVLSNPGAYSPGMVKKANFARNAASWKHGFGGNLFSHNTSFGHLFDKGGNTSDPPSRKDIEKWFGSITDEEYKTFLQDLAKSYSTGVLPRKLGKSPTREALIDFGYRGPRGAVLDALEARYADYLKANSTAEAPKTNAPRIEDLAAGRFTDNPYLYHWIYSNYGKNSQRFNDFLDPDKLDRYDFSKLTSDPESYAKNLKTIEGLRGLIKQAEVENFQITPEFLDAAEGLGISLADINLNGTQEETLNNLRNRLAETSKSAYNPARMYLKVLNQETPDSNANGLGKKYYQDKAFNRIADAFDEEVDRAFADNDLYNSLSDAAKEEVKEFYAGQDLESKSVNQRNAAIKYILRGGRGAGLSKTEGELMRKFVPGMADYYGKDEEVPQDRAAIVTGNTDVSLDPIRKLKEIEAKEAEEMPDVPPPSKLANLRFVPAFGAGIAAFSDLMGWTNKPNFSNAQALLNAANSIKDVRATPIGDYMRYTPLDRLYYANQLGAQAGATRRNIMNTSGGNRGAAMAGLIGADNTALSKYGELFRQGDEYNFGQLKAVKDFNRATNLANADNFLKAQSANQSKSTAYVDAVAKANALRDQELARVSAARSANLTNLFENIGNIGIDTYNRNDRNMLIRAGIPGTLSERPQDMTASEWDAYQKGLQIARKQGKRKQGITI